MNYTAGVGAVSAVEIVENTVKQYGEGGMCVCVSELTRVYAPAARVYI